jgi:hypothetical protein
VPEQKKGPAPARTGHLETLNHNTLSVADPCATNGCRLRDYHQTIANERCAEAFQRGAEHGQADLLGACASAMSGGATRSPRRAVREHLIPMQRAAEAREAARSYPATPVATVWADDDPIPVRQPSEANEAYVVRWTAAYTNKGVSR